MRVCSSFTNAYHVPVNTASHASSAAALKHALVHDASCMQLKSTCLPAPPSNAAQGDIKLSKPAHKHEDSFNVSFASPASCMVAVAKPSVAEAQRAPAAAAFNYGKKIFEIENVGFPQKKLRFCPTAPSRARRFRSRFLRANLRLASTKTESMPYPRLQVNSAPCSRHFFRLMHFVTNLAIKTPISQLKPLSPALSHSPYQP